MSEGEKQQRHERSYRVPDLADDPLLQSKEDLERRYLNVTEANRMLVMRKQQQLRSLVTQLTTTEQRERKQLATELHDYLAQMMVLGRIKIRKTRAQATADDPALMKSIDDVDEIFSKSLAYTRSLMSELNPPVQETSLSSSLECLAEEMLKHGLRVEVDLAKLPIPFPENQCMMLYQSVRELLINVVKHAETSSAKISLSIDDRDGLQIVVQDSGPGFDIAAHVVKTTGRHFGISSIRERMEAMGGWLEMESTLNRGTTVTLGLPLTTESQTEAMPKGSITGGQMKTAPASDKSDVIRVMLVDDHAMIRQGLRTILDGYNDLTVVAEASNGLEAVCVAADEMPDVIVMDVSMPKMDGIEATRQIKAFHPTAVIIAISADNPRDYIEAMVRAGTAAYITKEVPADELHNTIVTLAGRPH